METTTNTTLSVAEAWRSAISLTFAEVKHIFHRVYEWALILSLLAYLFTAVALIFSEGESPLPNVVGLAMVLAMVAIARHYCK